MHRREVAQWLKELCFCPRRSSDLRKMVTLKIEAFGVYKGKNVQKFTWTTSAGAEISVISYGAIIQAFKVPDKYGVKKDLVLGFDDLEGYVQRNTPYLGATVGRCANRIGNATFEIDGKTYNVAKNIGKDHLHGGIVGFDKVVWDTTIVGHKVIFSYLSKDLEEGYPGDLITNVIYEVTDDNRLHLDFKATTTKKTVVNLTNHSYFNLAGHDAGAEELYCHWVVINADKITKTDDNSIPTGSFIPVQNTPFDFTVQRKLGDAMALGSNLFDDNYCIETYGPEILTFASAVTHPASGRFLEVHTNQPGVQFYTANFLPSPSEPALVGKSGVGYRRHGAFCLETQTYPDAVHHENFPTAVLVPGEVYNHRVVYRFGVYNTDKVVEAPFVMPA
nr:galactose mutarotase isoform X1 [Helicoverpa armigera]